MELGEGSYMQYYIICRNQWWNPYVSNSHPGLLIINLSTAFLIYIENKKAIKHTLVSILYSHLKLPSLLSWSLLKNLSTTTISNLLQPIPKYFCHILSLCLKIQFIIILFHSPGLDRFPWDIHSLHCTPPFPKCILQVTVYPTASASCHDLQPSIFQI